MESDWPRTFNRRLRFFSLSPSLNKACGGMCLVRGRWLTELTYNCKIQKDIQLYCI